MAMATTGQLTSVACLDRSQAGSQTDMRPARSHQTRSELAVSIELLAGIDQLARRLEPPGLLQKLLSHSVANLHVT
jgi:hypothetical protein